jgi:hypothetical protein
LDKLAALQKGVVNVCLDRLAALQKGVVNVCLDKLAALQKGVVNVCLDRLAALQRLHLQRTTRTQDVSGVYYCPERESKPRAMLKRYNK